MRVRRNRIRGRGKFYLHRTLGDYILAALEAAKHLYTLTIFHAKTHKLLAIAILIHTDIDVVKTLLLRDCRERNGESLFLLVGDEEYLCISALNDITRIIKLKYNHNLIKFSTLKS